ncbi:MAG: Arm DNA-binding domain-containing protein [Bacteroidales bacterium]
MLSQKYSRTGVTITIVCDQRRVKKNEKYLVKLCVCLNRKQRYFPTGIALSLEEWDTIHNSKKADLIKV